jgi:squalene-hopene/tetraprenyl-beta-curcumene cyclase
MSFPHALGFTGTSERVSGDIFSRAILGTLLFDIAEATGGDAAMRDVAVEQAEYVASRRLQDSAAGWSYFPDLPELPPDIDSLAAAIALFSRAAPHHLASCEEPVRIALSQRAADGTIPTFLISPRDEGPRLDAMQRGVQLYFGNGADVDALARFYHALLLLLPEEYARLTPLEWFASRQQTDGSWLAPWYAGPYYGTRLCYDLFHASAPGHVAAAKARQFLLGVPPEAAPMDLATSEVSKDALVAQQASDGSWRPSPWIQMPIGRASGKVTRTITWQSRTISTALCLRALTAAPPRETQA